MNHHELWLEQNPTRKGGKDVNANNISEEKTVRSEKQTIWSEKEISEGGKTLQSEGEKSRRQSEERKHKEKAFEQRTQQGPTRKVHKGTGGIVIRIG